MTMMAELVKFSKDSQRIVHEVDQISSRAEGYNLALPQDVIDTYDNSSMQDLYKHYIITSRQLQERLQKATTFSEIETLEAHAINQLDNILFANDSVHAHLYGDADNPKDTGLFGRIFSDKAREDNPYEMDLVRVGGSNSEFITLHKHGKEMMDAIEHEQNARNAPTNQR